MCRITSYTCIQTFTSFSLSLSDNTTHQDIIVFHQPPSIILTGYEPGPAPYYSRLHLHLPLSIILFAFGRKTSNLKISLISESSYHRLPRFSKNSQKPPTIMTSNDQSSKVFYSSKYGSIKKLDGTKYMKWKNDVTEIPRRYPSTYTTRTIQ
jgi:hypothetical protein